MMSRLKKCQSALDRFLFDTCDPRICSLLRVAYACVLLVYVSMWMLESDLWFSNAGLLQAETAQAIGNYEFKSLLFWLPTDPFTVRVCLVILWLQAALLLLGCWSRWQCLCIFIWLVSFQHRNGLICDGQDVLIRLMSFYMMWMPLDYMWSIRNVGSVRKWVGKKSNRPVLLQVTSTAADHCELAAWTVPSAWALRLVQFQVTVIYVSTVVEKLHGVTWRNGTALYYVSRMDDLFGRFPLPAFMFESPQMVAWTTWSVLVVESALPVLLWLPRLRWLGVALAIGLHLSIEYAMHVFLFEWLMLVSLLAFVEPQWWPLRLLPGFSSSRRSRED